MAHRDSYRPSHNGMSMSNNSERYTPEPRIDRYQPGNGRGRGRGEQSRYDERDRYQPAQHYRNSRDHDSRRDQDDGRVPPPREERWQRDRYDDGHHNQSMRQESGVMRFPGPPNATPMQAPLPGFAGLPAKPMAAAPVQEELPQKPRKQPTTTPNQSVILIGIPQMCTDEDLKSFIDEFKANPSDPSPVENATIVLDKVTGMSKRFGFARFITLEHARAFVEANFDHVFWNSRGSHDITEDGVKVRIDYASVDKRPGQSSAEARAAGGQQAHVPVNMNDGFKDMGSQANKMLLIRNLDPLTKEADIARSLENMNEETEQRVRQAQGPRRIILIKDRVSNASWCFAFVIYPEEESAKAALRTILLPDTFPTGYTIHQKLVAVTYARVGCFNSAYTKTAWTFQDETSDGKQQEYLYWDEGGYASIYDAPAYITALEKKQEDAAKQADVDAFFSSLESDTKIAPEDEVVQAPPSINLSFAGNLGPAGSKLKAKGKGPTELIISKKIAVDINKWNQKKAEDIEPPAGNAEAISTNIIAARPAQHNAPVAGSSNLKRSSPPPVIPEGLKYADMSDEKTPKCLLCQRQFKSVEILQKHSLQSALHKTNLADSAKVEAAKEAISKLPANSGEDAAASVYRDRALERRAALNQPDHPAPQSKKQKTKHSELLPKPAASVPETPIEESNIGSRLLAGMGWTAGSGLGNTSVGRVDPIQAKAFAAGAGIGASRGVIASEQAADAWGGGNLGRSKARQRMMEEEIKNKPL